MVTIIKKSDFASGGMTCHSCERKIEDALGGLDGIVSVKADYSAGRTSVEYDTSKASEDQIRRKIDECGYKSGGSAGSAFGAAAIALGLLAILAGTYLLLGRGIGLGYDISPETGFAALFALGFLTGFHCIGMCGGFVLSYSGSMKRQGDIGPHLLYGAGKMISYSVMGAIFGLAGAFISFTPGLRGGVALLAGFFLVIYGLNMLDIFPALRRFQPRLPSIIPGGWRNKGPLATGLLNGLMIACGPLQALYIYAAGTGSAIMGAQTLFFFGLGTLVPLLGFGVASSFISSALSGRIVRFSGALVILLGMAMALNGANLLGLGSSAGSGIVLDGSSDTQINVTLSESDQMVQVIRMDVGGYGWKPDSFVLRRGVPVRWEINAEQLNGCNNEILVPEYGLDIKLKPGLQTVEFIPDEEGVFGWSCWMGMIPGRFTVTDDVGSVGQESIWPAGNGSQAGTCGASCGGGCGGSCGGGCGCSAG